MTNSRKKYEKKVNDKYFLPKLVGDLLLVTPIIATLGLGAIAIGIKDKLTQKNDISLSK